MSGRNVSTETWNAAAPDEQGRSMNPKHALWMLIAGSALVRVIAALSLGLGNDEAYHALYAAHPALSYYDHPPMMAWVEMATLSLVGNPTSTWALRIGFITLFAGSTWILARLTSRYYGGWAGFVAAFALNVTGYYGLAAGTFALPDGPLLFFWLLTIDRLALALAEPDSRRLTPWIWVGFAWGGAMLSKYHAVLIPVAAALCIVLHRPMRRWVVQPGPYLASGLGMCLFSPVVIWNASHEWASFLFQGGRAMGSWMPRPDYLLGALLAQAGYLFPWIWVPLVIIAIRQCRNWPRIGSGEERLWLCLAIVPLAVFTAVACFRPVLPHWGLIGLVSLFPILGRNWAARLERRPRPTHRILAACAGFSVVFLAVVIAEYRYGWLQRDGRGGWGLVDTRTDPTLDLYGWDQVAERLKRLGLLDDPRTFVFTSYWYQSAQIAHALGHGQPVLCYNADDPRGFAFWSRPDDWIGRDGILVVVGEIESWPKYFGRWFASVEPASDFWVERNGKPVRRIQVYLCTQQRLAYPFAYDQSTRLARSRLEHDVEGRTSR
jgi:4-amino-4-deoxy-L-arabinose transferase-like glycosyltransferase